MGTLRLEKTIRGIATEAILYQAQSALALLDSIDDDTYPPQACALRNVFLVIVEKIHDDLWRICNGTDGDSHGSKTRQLARVLQEIHSYVRFLQASDPSKTTPSLQVALTSFTKRYFPHTGALTLVRPQWKYNLTYRSLTWDLREIIKPAELDPQDKLRAQTSDDLLQKLWKQKFGPKGPDYPKHIAVISFAGLDTDDTLLLPLLWHELGHFIDFGREAPTPDADLDSDLYHRHSNSKELREISVPSMDTLEHRLPADKKLSQERIENLYEELVTRIEVCRREMLADLLAARMMGLPFFIAQAEFLKTLFSSPQKITSGGYPGLTYRLQIVYNEVMREKEVFSVKRFLGEHKTAHGEVVGLLESYLEEWRGVLASESCVDSTSDDEIEQTIDRLASEAIDKASPILERSAKSLIPDEECAVLTPDVFPRIDALRKDVPPYMLGDRVDHSLPEIFVAGWAYQIFYGDKREEEINTSTERCNEYRKTCRLIEKAIELSALDHGLGGTKESKFTVGSANSEMAGACSGPTILRRLRLPANSPERMWLVPCNEESVQEASVDVHLGYWFKIGKRARLGSIDLGVGNAATNRKVLMSQEKVFVGSEKRLIMHPGDLVLGVTLEFLALPGNLMAYVEGKSQLGRKGLIVATATQVAPGFHGVIVLELVNAGVVPLEIAPGMAIAQVVLHTLTQPIPEGLHYRGASYCQIRP